MPVLELLFVQLVFTKTVVWFNLRNFPRITKITFKALTMTKYQVVTATRNASWNSKHHLFWMDSIKQQPYSTSTNTNTASIPRKDSQLKSIKVQIV